MSTTYKSTFDVDSTTTLHISAQLIGSEQEPSFQTNEVNVSDPKNLGMHFIKIIFKCIKFYYFHDPIVL